MKGRFFEELGRIFNKFPKYRMKILLGNSDAITCREDIFKQTIRNKSYTKLVMILELEQQASPYPKNLIVKSTMFPYYNIRKFTCTSPGGKMQSV
jgi:hypothetical protein